MIDTLYSVFSVVPKNKEFTMRQLSSWLGKSLGQAYNIRNSLESYGLIELHMLKQARHKSLRRNWTHFYKLTSLGVEAKTLIENMVENAENREDVETMIVSEVAVKEDGC